METTLHRIGQLVYGVPALDRMLDRVDVALPYAKALAACGDVGYACVHDCSSQCGGYVWGYWYANTFSQCEHNVLNGYFGDPIGPGCF